MQGNRRVARRAWWRRAAAPVALALALGAAPACSETGTPVAEAGTVVTIGRPTPVTLVGGVAGGGAATFALTAPGPAHGQLTGTPPNVVYTPAAGFLGTDSFAFSVTSPAGTTATATVTLTVKRPNVVVVMADDQTLDQQKYLGRVNQLIGAQGTTFRNYVNSYPECCPARATLLSGQYAHNHGVLSSAGDTGGATKFKDASSLATWLQGAGYFTGLAGKYFNAYGGAELPGPTLPGTYVPPGWSDWLALMEPTGYNFYDYDVSDNGRVVHRGTAESDYSTDVLFGRAESLIRTRGGAATPLFLLVTPTAPHATNGGLAAVPAKRHEGVLTGETAPRTPAYNQADVSAMPPWIAGLPPLTTESMAGIDNIYKLGAQSLQAVDEGVEKLYKALQDKGELDNTVFLYTSDNGYHYGDHRIVVGKSDQYEESVRAPLLARGPFFPAGGSVTQPVANIDLAPTIAAVAGVTPGIPVDGVPLFPFVNQPGYGAHRTIVIENGPLWGRRTWAGVRDDRWVYVESTGGGLTGMVQELYDLAKDPYQLRNIAGDPTAALALMNARTRLNQLRACAGAACQLGLG